MYCRSRTSIRRRCLAGFVLFEPDRLHMNRAGYLLRPRSSRQRPLPFAEAVRVGDMLYLSGQLGTDSSGQLVPGGIGPETRQALSNVATVLGRHGATLAQVIKCTVMLADIGEWAAMNEVYVTFFPKHLPARSAFGTTGLALGARLELECVAVLSDTEGTSS